jgi:hypothetical protein
MQAISTSTTSTTAGVAVRGAVKAGGSFQNHAEGVVGEAAAAPTDSAQRWGRHHRFQRRRARHRAGVCVPARDVASRRRRPRHRILSGARARLR